ncbi:MAG: type II secretion system protein [Alphaproteobacteria bacterium]
MRKSFNQNSCKAYTLTELSISLVIIGFIFSCVFVGNRIYNAANLRKIINENELYRTAVSNFRNSYNAVPGDMINAQSVLPKVASGLSVAGNGNGNGLVDTSAELYLMPQHLQAGGFLFNKFYNGTSDIIMSEITANSWSLNSFNQNIYNIWQANEINLLYYNKGLGLTNGSISPIDASNIDFKIDDGNATTGSVIAMVSSSSYSCISSANGTGTKQDSTYTGTDANYILTVTSRECELLFGASKAQIN